MIRSRESAIEIAKFWADYVKHLTTLSAGSLVLIATFLEKLLSRTPQWKPAIVVSMVGFLSSLLGGSLIFTAFALEAFQWHGTQVEDKPWQGLLAFIGLCLAWLGFVTGLAALTVFLGSRTCSSIFKLAHSQRDSSLDGLTRKVHYKAPGLDISLLFRH